GPQPVFVVGDLPVTGRLSPPANREDLLDGGPRLRDLPGPTQLHDFLLQLLQAAGILAGDFPRPRRRGLRWPRPPPPGRERGERQPAFRERVWQFPRGSDQGFPGRATAPTASAPVRPKKSARARSAGGAPRSLSWPRDTSSRRNRPLSNCHTPSASNRCQGK